MHLLAVAKAHFGFGGVHVHIGFGAGQLQKQGEGGGNGVVQHIAVGLFGRVQQHFVAHKALVNKAILLAAFALGKGGFADKAVEAHGAVAAVDGQRGCLKIGTQDGGHAFGQGLYGQGQGGFAVVA